MTSNSPPEVRMVRISDIGLLLACKHQEEEEYQGVAAGADSSLMPAGMHACCRRPL